MRQPVQEPCGVEVARAGGVDHFIHERSRDSDSLVAGDHDRAPLAASDGGQGADLPELLEAGLEALGLVQRQQLGLVGEEHIDVAVVEELQELGAPPVDTYRVGETQGGLAPSFVGHAHGLAEGVLGTRRVPQETLHVRDIGPGHHVLADIVGRQLVGRPQIGPHGALGVGRDQDQATARR